MTVLYSWKKKNLEELMKKLKEFNPKTETNYEFDARSLDFREKGKEIRIDTEHVGGYLNEKQAVFHVERGLTEKEKQLLKFIKDEYKHDSPLSLLISVLIFFLFIVIYLVKIWM